MIQREGGSFRDPSGFVFRHGDEVYRCMDGESWSVIEKLITAGLLDKWNRDGLLVATEPVASPSAVHESLPAQGGLLNPHLVRHERIPFVTYPTEWTCSMLADAALLTLDLQQELIHSGYSLKDASAFNVQFRSGRPVFIDIASIEIPARWDSWIAYGQFCRMFLFPLILKRFRNIDTRDVFLANIDGMDVVQVYGVVGALRSLCPSLFLDLFLQRQLQKLGKGAPVRNRQDTSDRASGTRGEREILLANLRRLSAKVTRLREYKTGTGVWSGYALSNSYTEESSGEKAGFVKEFVQTNKPASVLDLGSNTGRFSIIAADAGCRVVAVDSDHDCVDRMYREARERRKDILPLHMNIEAPTPAIGFMNRERSSFLERVDFDCVFALALIHHLLVTARIPLEAMRDMFCALTRRWLVVEFVPVDDPMFQRLLALRENIYGYFTREHFEKIMGERFVIVATRELGGSKRVVYAMERK